MHLTVILLILTYLCSHTSTKFTRMFQSSWPSIGAHSNSSSDTKLHQGTHTVPPNPTPQPGILTGVFWLISVVRIFLTCIDNNQANMSFHSQPQCGLVKPAVTKLFVILLCSHTSQETMITISVSFPLVSIIISNIWCHNRTQHTHAKERSHKWTAWTLWLLLSGLAYQGVSYSQLWSLTHLLNIFIYLTVILLTAPCVPIFFIIHSLVLSFFCTNPTHSHYPLRNQCLLHSIYSSLD